MATDLTLAEVLRQVLDARCAEIHVAVPCSVLTYHQASQTVDVQVMVKDFAPDEEGDLKERRYPVLPSVPVEWLRAGGYFLTMPIVAGDTGMLVFSELPIDRWRSTGQESNAVLARRHGLTNAVFRPGLSPAGKALAAPAVGDHLVLGKEGGAQVHVSASSIALGSANPIDAPTLNLKVKQQFAALIAALQTAFTAVGASTSANGANGAASIASFVAGDMGAMKVKAE